MFNRAEVVDKNFVRFVSGWSGVARDHVDPSSPVRPGRSLCGADLLELCASQMTARHLDLIARELRATDEGYYTISSAGHEGNAVLGRLTRVTDPAFVHYRSAAFMVERARKAANQNIIRDTILGQVASTDDPIAGGRHKVWGSRALWVPPQTSTIGSHLPKAVGTALAIRRTRHLGIDLNIPVDSIVMCGFGDASVNHSTSLGAFNSACYARFQHLPVPILFVCEDNGLGISVRTAPGWIEANFRHRSGMTYFVANGLDVVEAYAVAGEAVDYCRQHRSPVFLHFKVARLLGHAGSDFEFAYHTPEEVAAAEAKDPLLSTARIVLESGLRQPAELLDDYESIRKQVRAEAAAAVKRPKLESAQQIIAPLAPYHEDQVSAEARRVVAKRREEAFGGADQLPEKGPGKHMAVQINRALYDLMAKYDEMVLFGEDVAQKGGVYHVTTGLQKRFGPARVFNTLLDEQTILGLAQGFGAMGLLPVPEIQYLAYYHNAQDQIRGEACSLQFFSQGQYRNPMVMRIAAFGYQKGFGGHFHNDNSIAALRDIPGLIVAVPARGDDAVEMLRTAMSLARVDGRVVAFLEPIARYMTKDLHEAGDGGWLTDYPSPEKFAAFGEPRIYDGGATDLAIVTYGNGVYLSIRAAKRLRDAHGVEARVVDLRWLTPLNGEAIAKHAKACGRVLIVDEGRSTGGVAEAVMAAMIEGCDPVPAMSRVTGLDTYIPLGPAAELVLPSEDQIIEAACALARG